MVFQTEEEAVQGIKERYQPVKYDLTVAIVDKRFEEVKAEAEIRVVPVPAKGILEILIEELESDHIYAPDNGSIYDSFGIDESIQIYDEVLETIPLAQMVGNDAALTNMDGRLSEESLKGHLEKALNAYRFTDMSGKYRFNKRCSIKEMKAKD
ncbi:hypothetical protein [Bacillus massiliglaciei]|uniref:hypothetical protein n=1 Tax=Bacillus massiliglaciei TaxID=1816693 RepID=UPI000DA63FA6|nr:hypothetical protein [Bacillus massiliglaciei]